MKLITIISVYFTEETKKLIELKYILAKKQNPGIEFDFIAVDNSIGEKISSFTHEFSEIRVIKGMQSESEIEYCPKKHYLGSYYHAFALNKIIRNREIKSRFALFIDTDCFILRPNWIFDVTKHMEQSALLFFGTPNDPSRFLKFRYFPSVQCFFVDFHHSLFERNKLDFTPDAGKFVFRRKIYDLITSFTNIGNMFYTSPIRERLKRMIIGTSRDTACRIYDNYFANKSIYELAKPVFKRSPSFADKIVPDFLSYVPKSYPDYYIKKSFTESGFTYNIEEYANKYFWHGKPISFNKCYERGYEEYFWQDRPFAVHMRIRKNYFKTKAEMI